MFIPSLARVPSSSISSPFDGTPILFSSLNDETEYVNPPLPTQTRLALAPQLPKWVDSTQEETSDLVGDPLDHHHTHFQF